MTNYPVIFEAKLAVVELSYGKYLLACGTYRVRIIA